MGRIREEVGPFIISREILTRPKKKKRRTKETAIGVKTGIL